MLGIEPSSRLGMVARGPAGEGEARHARGELAREHAADGAEAGNGDAGCRHVWPLGLMRAPTACLLRGPPIGHKPMRARVKQRLDRRLAEDKSCAQYRREPNA